MKIWILLLTVLILSGCANEKGRVQPPDWGSIDQIVSDAAPPEPLPVLCEIPDWDLECWSMFEMYEEVSVANYDLGVKNFSALNKTEQAHNHLANAGKMQNELSNFFLDLLDQEKQERAFDAWTYRVIILLGVGLAL
jgi:hypothetical protein